MKSWQWKAIQIMKCLFQQHGLMITIEKNNNGKPYKVFEVSWGEESEDYKKGHIPGAVHINTDEVEEGPVWNRLSDAELEQFALKNGITTDTTVILYGS